MRQEIEIALEIREKSHLALERQENVTERFTDEGHLLERQD